MNELLSEWEITEGHLDVAPEEVGLDSRQLNKLDNHFLDLISQQKIQAASYLVARQGKVAAWKSMGRLHGSTNHGELQPDSLRKMSSITKSFTNVAIMKLIEDGKLYIEVELMTRRHLFNVPAYHWGGKIKDIGHALGFDLAINHLSFESVGTFQLEGAGRTGFFVDPVEKLVVVIMVPSIYSWVPESVLGSKQIIWSSLF
jgi:CubicO group peptidase (beta-lactamase class C family)